MKVSDHMTLTFPQIVASYLASTSGTSCPILQKPRQLETSLRLQIQYITSDEVVRGIIITAARILHSVTCNTIREVRCFAVFEFPCYANL